MRVLLGFKKSVSPNESLFSQLTAYAIQKYTKSKYFHVEICLNNSWISSSPDYGGVRIRRLRPSPSRNWDYYELQVIQLTPIQNQILMRFVENQVGSKYDWLGVFSKVVKPLKDSQTKWYCSEITTKILQLLYVEEVLDIEPQNTTPASVFNLLKHRLEYIPHPTLIGGK